MYLGLKTENNTTMKHKIATDKETVRKALAAWGLARKTPEQLIPLFERVSGFTFYYDARLHSKIHIYPGLIQDPLAKDQLVFYSIPEFRDKKKEDPFHYVEQSDVIHIVRYDHISDAEGEARIMNWGKHYGRWMSRQKKGLFQAFVIPVDDFEGDGGKYVAYLGLKFHIDETLDSAGLEDLVLIKDDNTYFDTVRPVPPFKPYKMPYLLGLEP